MLNFLISPKKKIRKYSRESHYLSLIKQYLFVPQQQKKSTLIEPVVVSSLSNISVHLLAYRSLWMAMDEWMDGKLAVCATGTERVRACRRWFSVRIRLIAKEETSPAFNLNCYSHIFS